MSNKQTGNRTGFEPVTFPPFSRTFWPIELRSNPALRHHPKKYERAINRKELFFRHTIIADCGRGWTCKTFQVTAYRLLRLPKYFFSTAPFNAFKRITNASEKKHELHNIAVEAGFEPTTFPVVHRDALPKYHCATTPFNGNSYFIWPVCPAVPTGK